MAEVFISYSRRDKGFVRRLGEAVAAQKREAWVDWKDIPLTAEWQQEIFTNIVAADNFLFVISPESASSVNCRKEIDHAAANNKRMIPIFHIPVADEAIPEALGKFQRIDFCGDDDFDSKFAALVKAIDTDLDWVQTHTRLLTRAKEWERASKDSSFLLRGSDLREAEKWIAKSTEKEPKPSTLHSQYLLASRQAATNLQRKIVGAVLIAFLISVGLMIYAFRERNAANVNATEAKKQREAAESNATKARNSANEANQQRDFADKQKQLADERRIEAERQRQVALARQMAAQADLTASNGDMERALLLSAEGARRLISTQTSNLEVDLALRRALTLFPYHVADLTFDTGSYVDAVSFTNDGHVVAASKRPAVALDSKSYFGEFRQTVIGAGGRFAASVADDARNGTAFVWEPSTRQEKARLPYLGSANDVAVSSDGDYLALSTETYDQGKWQHTTSVWHVPSHTQIASFSDLDTIEFDPSGPYLLIGGPHEVAFWKIDHGEHSRLSKVAVVPKVNSVFDLAFSADGRYFAASMQEDEKIHVWKRANLKELGKTPIGSHLALSSNGRYVAVVVNDKVSVFDVNTQQEIARIPRTTIPVALSFAPGRDTLAVADYSGVAVWRLATGSDLAWIDNEGPVSSMAFSPDETLLLTAAHTVTEKDKPAEITARVIDLRQPARNSDVVQQFQAVTAGFAVDGRTLLVAQQGGQIASFDILGHKRLKDPPCSPHGQVTSVRRNDRYLVFAVDLPKGEALQVCDTLKGTLSSLSTAGVIAGLSRHGHTLAVVTASGPTRAGAKLSVELWDLSRVSRISQFSVGFDMAMKLALSEDAELLALAYRPNTGTEGSIVIKTTAKGHIVKTIVNQPRVSAIAFSADHRLVAWVDGSGTARVWNLESGIELSRLNADAQTQVVMFSPHNRYLAFVDRFGAVQIARLSINDLYEEACKRLGRNLPEIEWRQYFGRSEPYQQTCPK